MPWPGRRSRARGLVEASPGEPKLNLVAVVLLFCLIPLLGGALYWGAKLLRALNLRSGGWAITAVLGLTAVGAVLIVTSQGGPTISGVVAGKTETVELTAYEVIPTVTHHLRVTIIPGTTDPRRGPFADTLTFDTGPATFDRLSVGQTIELRQVSLGPLTFATLRPSGAPAAFPDLEFARVGSIAAKLATVLAIFALAVFAGVGSRWRVVIILITLLAVGLDLLALRTWWSPRPLHGAATITDVRTVREAHVLDWFNNTTGRYYTFSLPVPYDEVQLQLISTGRVPSVLAVDRVDAGSSGALSRGQVVDVVYSGASPREARLSGRRSYAWRAYLAYAGMLAIAGFLVMLLTNGLALLGRKLQETARLKRTAPPAPP